MLPAFCFTTPSRRPKTMSFDILIKIFTYVCIDPEGKRQTSLAVEDPRVAGLKGVGGGNTKGVVSLRK